MLLKKGKSTFKIFENKKVDYSEPDYFDHYLDYDKLNNPNIIRTKKIILFDEDGDEFELFIKNKKLEIKPHF